MDNRPRGRQKNIGGVGKDIYRRGAAQGMGPVGSFGGYSGRGGSRRGGGKRGSLPIIVILAMLLFGGGGIGLNSLGGSDTQYSQPAYSQQSGTQPSYSLQSSSYTGAFHNSSVSSGWQNTANTAKPDTTVDPAAREKYTEIIGNDRDTVTVMVYMCGTDLESRSGMASSDLKEMANAALSDNVNVIVYTGGCKSWQNSIVSSSVNQIYKVESGGLRTLVKDAGSVSMTKPETLASFIKFCGENYPANRNELILWDHGGGSISGYGYDEKYSSSGSMTLQGIGMALDAAGMKFDFIGFDACLMATLENALMLSPYADYMIASEETEPGVGWYYTNWLSSLSQNSSLSTLEVGQQIVDDFVSYCAQKCPGQKTTLSVVDLSELETTVPAALTDFAESTAELLEQNRYTEVSNARSSTREFASSSKIDQIDLVHFANNLGTLEAKELSEKLLSAVKYNRCSSNMTNAYGLSIYFPYQKVSKVNSAVAQYEAIGMDSEYASVIKQFASMEVAGQAVSGGAASPLPNLIGSAADAGSVGIDMISQLLNGLMNGDLYGVSGMSGANSGFIGRSLDNEGTAEFLFENRFDADNLVWTGSGTPSMYLSEQQWSLVHDLELNVFFDDGTGYIDLGLDNVFDFNADGALIGAYDGTWLAINDQPVAYYHIDTYDDGSEYCITGRVPVLLNGVRADLILVFDNEHPYGYVAGAQYDYREGETETVAKNLTELHNGDTLDFLCDYYGYDGSCMDSYMLGDRMIVDGDLYISNVYINASAANACYRFTDIYNQQYWSPVIPG